MEQKQYNIKEMNLDDLKNIDKNEIQFISLRDGTLAYVTDENDQNTNKNKDSYNIINIKENDEEYISEPQMINPENIQYINEGEEKYYNTYNNINPNMRTDISSSNINPFGDIIEERENYRLFASGVNNSTSQKKRKIYNLKQNNNKNKLKINYENRNVNNSFSPNYNKKRKEYIPIENELSLEPQPVEYYKIVNASPINNFSKLKMRINSDINERNNFEDKYLKTYYVNNNQSMKNLFIKNYNESNILTSPNNENFLENNVPENELEEDNYSNNHRRVNSMYDYNIVNISKNRNKKIDRNSKKGPVYLENYCFKEVKAISSNKGIYKRYI